MAIDAGRNTVIDFPPLPAPPAPRGAPAAPPAAAPRADSELIRALVMQGIFEMVERTWW